MAEVKFKEGTTEQFNNLIPDENTFYKIINTDGNIDVFLGEEQLNNEAALQEILIQLTNLKDQVEDLEHRVYDLEFPAELFEGYAIRDIIDILNQGIAEDYWSVGDLTESIPLHGTVGSREFNYDSFRAMIIGFNHNSELETNSYDSICFQFGTNDDNINIAFTDSFYNSQGATDGFRMNVDDTTAGGWESSYMRNTICSQFLEALPTWLSQSIGTTIKYTDNGQYSHDDVSYVTPTEDKIFLLSCNEIDSENQIYNLYESDYTTVYSDYYNNSTLYSGRPRFDDTNPSTQRRWWLRSPMNSQTSAFCNLSSATSPAVTYSSPNYSYGFSPAFNLIGTDVAFVFKPLNECSPALIQKIVQAGQAANCWSVGDVTKNIKLTGTVGDYVFNQNEYRALLIGLDHNKDMETEGKNNACFQFGYDDNQNANIAFDHNFPMQKDTDTNVDGWKSSYMRNTICSQFLEVLPNNWNSIIGTTTKYTGDEGSIASTEDKIFLLGYFEVGFSSVFANSIENLYTQQYSEWYNSNANRIRISDVIGQELDAWWLRSPYARNSDSFCMTTAGGTSNYSESISSFGFAPAFTVF